MKTPNNLIFFGGTGGLGKKVTTILEATGQQVEVVGSKLVDVTLEHDISNFFHGRDDVGNLVIFTNHNHNSFLHKYDEDDLSQLEKQIDINILGVTRVISRALKIMRKNRYGRIIIASSVLVNDPEMGTGIYSASKAFYENLVKTICKENASYNITANAMRLGYMDGGLTFKLPEEFLEKKLQEVPAGRLGTPGEIAKTINYLIDTPYVNGATIKLTGGL